MSLYFLPLIAGLLVIILTPAFRKIAIFIGLTDQPNIRKKHKHPIPLVGGIVIFIAAGSTFLLYLNQVKDWHLLHVLIVGAFILLLTGAIDDKLDIRASNKLAIELMLAWFVFSSGIRIESFYGCLGIYDLPYYVQAVVTILIITGTINAFNLTDGIDGLAGSLMLLALIMFGILALILGKYDLLALFAALAGAIIGFLRFNLSHKSKIFMGDAGSLFLGYIMVISGISLLQSAKNHTALPIVLTVVIGVMALPVFDSLRVYRFRIKAGYSPFRADRTHFHHLVVGLGVSHRKATLVVIGIVLTLLALAIVLGLHYSVMVCIIALFVVLNGLAWCFRLFCEVTTWRQRIREFEGAEPLSDIISG